MRKSQELVDAEEAEEEQRKEQAKNNDICVVDDEQRGLTAQADNVASGN